MNGTMATETAAQMWTIVVAGIGTVFLCLFALVIMTTIFKRIFVKAPRAKPVEEKPSAAPAPIARPAGVEGAIVAAIAAAVAAASGVPVSALRIASIERSGFNTPAWGHVDRA